MSRASVVVPTHGRPALLERCLARLAPSAPRGTQLIVSVDGPAHEVEPITARAAEAATGLSVELVEGPSGGPGAARNRGLARAVHEICVFCDDDILATPQMLPGHLAFHARHPEREAALLGLVVPAPPLDACPFNVWLHTEGVQFAYGRLTDGPAPAEWMWTANLSLKTGLLQDAGGFDEHLDTAYEDMELGLRLEREHGMRLIYDSSVVGEHYRPTDLPATLRRVRRAGHAARGLPPELRALRAPRARTARDRVLAGSLGLAYSAKLPLPLKRRAWSFLCAQAFREAYWSDANGDPGVEPELELGSLLLARASRDPETRTSG